MAAYGITYATLSSPNFPLFPILSGFKEALFLSYLEASWLVLSNLNAFFVSFPSFELILTNRSCSILSWWPLFCIIFTLWEFLWLYRLGDRLITSSGASPPFVLSKSMVAACTRSLLFLMLYAPSTATPRFLPPYRPLLLFALIIKLARRLAPLAAFRFSFSKP